jgi:hypothetical protein
MYVVDVSAVADAILTRTYVRLSIPDSRFGCDHADDSALARSFRHNPAARSFRLSRQPILRRAHH